MRTGNVILLPAGGTISVSEVAGLLGVPRQADHRYHLPDVCRSASINPYARYKSVNHSTPAKITVAQRQSVNCGIDCSDSATGCFADSLGDLLTRARESAEWNHAVPLLHCRLLDFNGYDHAAAGPYAPIQGLLAGNAESTQGGAYINLTLHPVIESGNIRLSDLVEALERQGDEIADYHYGLIYRPAGSSAAPALIDLGAADLGAPIDKSFQIRLAPPNYNESVTYECVFIAFVESGLVWATFIPKTFFTVNLALFSVSIEGQTLSFPKTGGTASFYVSGYCWKAEWAAGDINMTLTPSSATGTAGTWSEVELSVGQAIANPFGEVVKTITVSAPGRVSDPTVPGGDFRKTFTVRQECDYSNFIMAVDTSGNPLNGIPFDSLSPGFVTAVRIRSNTAWSIDSIVWDDDQTSDNPNTDANRISCSPASGGLSGNITDTVVDFWGGNGIVPGRRYRIKFVSTDPNRPAEFTLKLIA